VNGPPQAQLESSTREVLAGLVERITFHNVENGFCVLRIKARGHRELITVIGHAAVIAAGEWVEIIGNGSQHGIADLVTGRTQIAMISAPLALPSLRCVPDACHEFRCRGSIPQCA